MKPGDLVQITVSCHSSDGMVFKEGDIGLVLGPARDAFNRARGCHLLFINDRIEDFGENMIEVINETR
jgi:hypothetical protein